MRHPTTRPPPTPTFTFRVFFNFHLENKVIYMSGSCRRRCTAHVSRSDAIGDAPAIAHKARGRSALWCAKCAYLRGPFVHCLPRDGGWHCDTFILGHFLWRPLYWELDIGAEFTKHDIIGAAESQHPSVSPRRAHCVSSFNGYS